MPPGALVKEEVVVKREHEVVVDEGGRSEGRPKRRRNYWRPATEGRPSC